MYEYFMKEALKEAAKAREKGEVPVGALIVKDGKIISRAHNLRQTKQNSLYHAEILAIDKACKKLKNFRLEECEMYITLEPCTMCVGAIVQARIKRVIYGAKDEKYGMGGTVFDAFKLKSNHEVEIVSNIMNNECSKILKDFFIELRKNKKTSK